MCISKISYNISPSLSPLDYIYINEKYRKLSLIDTFDEKRGILIEI